MIDHNNGWISLKHQTPKLSKNEFSCSSDLICFGQEDYTDEPHIFIGYMIDGARFYSSNGECYKVSHWRELPPYPPKELE